MVFPKLATGCKALTMKSPKRVWLIKEKTWCPLRRKIHSQNAVVDKEETNWILYGSEVWKVINPNACMRITRHCSWTAAHSVKVQELKIMQCAHQWGVARDVPATAVSAAPFAQRDTEVTESVSEVTAASAASTAITSAPPGGKGANARGCTSSSSSCPDSFIGAS